MKKKIGILLPCLVMMSYLAVSPALADISGEFSNVSISTVQMLITLPCLIGLVTSLIAGKMVAYIYKKTIIVASVACYVAGGLIPVFWNNSMAVLLICSGIMGIGCGGMMTCTAGIICDYYEGKERNQMMGLQAACIAGGGTIFTVLGGWLASEGWRKAYLSYFLVILCLVGVVILLPKGKLEKAEAGEKGGSIPGYVWFLSLMGFLFYTFQNTFNTNASLYVVERGLGGASQASFLTSVNTFAGMVAGVILGQVMAKLKKYTVPFAFGIAAVGLFLTYIGTSLPVILVGGACVGFAFSTYTPAGTSLVSEHVSVSQRSMGIAILSAANNVGAAASPYIVNSISKIFSPTVQVKYLVSAVIIVVIMLATALKFKKEK